MTAAVQEHLCGRPRLGGSRALRREGRTPHCATLEVVGQDAGAPGRVRIWTTATKGTEVSLPKTWNLGGAQPETMPETLYIEGVEGSLALGDVRFRLSYSLVIFGMVIGTCNDHVRVTVVDVDLDLQGVAEEDEETKGGFVCFNGDDDNANGTVDKLETGVTNEDDLWPITLQVAPPGLTGTVAIQYQGPTVPEPRIRLWQEPTKVTSVGPPHQWVLGQDAVPATLYAEGRGASLAPANLKLSLVYTSPQGGTCMDRVSVTVVVVDINPDAGQAGMTGDEVAGMLTGGATGTPWKHYVSPREIGGHVQFRADVVPQQLAFQEVFEWVGGQPGPTPQTRRVPRGAATHEPLQVRLIGTTAPCDVMNAWIVWCDIAQHGALGVVSAPGDILIAAVPYRKPEQPQIVFDVTINPASMIDGTATAGDIPNLAGANSQPLPPGADPTGAAANPYGGGGMAGGVDRRWDVSRRVRRRWLELDAGGVPVAAPMLTGGHWAAGALVPAGADAVFSVATNTALVAYGGLPDGDLVVLPTPPSPAPGMPATPDSYPAVGLMGNDDRSKFDEDNLPYSAAETVNGFTAPIGHLSSVDEPVSVILRRGAAGAAGRAAELRMQFQEFARLQIGNNPGPGYQNWYVVSDGFSWRAHFRFIYNAGTGQWDNVAATAVAIDNANF